MRLRESATGHAPWKMHLTFDAPLKARRPTAMIEWGIGMNDKKAQEHLRLMNNLYVATRAYNKALEELDQRESELRQALRAIDRWFEALAKDEI